jgi:hypothetical protein
MSAFLHGRDAPDGEGALLVRGSLWCFACFLLAGRSRIPARREGVSQANGAFDQERLRASGTRTRSLPAMPRLGLPTCPS